jgi:hypothetical protein
MAQDPPKSQPEPPRPQPQVGNPQPDSSVYGGQWGSSGKQNPEPTGEPDRPEPIQPARNGK